jgi:uroporphyrinogen-III synthase
MKRVAVLRPEPGASATLRRARQLGLDAFALPLFELRSLPWTAPSADQFDALLLTSANAVRLAGKQLASLRTLPAHTVGERTAAAARAAGLSVASVGSKGVDALLASLPAELRLLHLCGEERREPEQAGQVITAQPVYAAAAIDDVDHAALRGSVALVHSPRAGARLAELAPDRVPIAIAAISPAAAASCGAGWERVEAAEGPNDAALLPLALRMCQESRPK